MLLSEQQKELFSLVEDGRVSPIQEFMTNYNKDNIYIKYIQTNNPCCVCCGSIITTLDYDLIRHTDCGDTNWYVGNCCDCCCGREAMDYSQDHKPNNAQFYCSPICYNKASEVVRDARQKVCNTSGNKNQTEELWTLYKSTDYTKISAIIKKYCDNK